MFKSPRYGRAADAYRDGLRHRVCPVEPEWSIDAVVSAPHPSETFESKVQTFKGHIGANRSGPYGGII